MDFSSSKQRGETTGERPGVGGCGVLGVFTRVALLIAGRLRFRPAPRVTNISPPARRTGTSTHAHTHTRALAEVTRKRLVAGHRKRRARAGRRGRGHGVRDTAGGTGGYLARACREARRSAGSAA
jgi:hypothetical protein